MVCAFSYGFRFNKVALGGCTPIDYMKKTGDSYRRGQVSQRGGTGPKIVQPAAASMADWKRLAPTVDPQAAMDALGPARSNWLLSAPLPPAVPKPVDTGDGALTAAVPLS